MFMTIQEYLNFTDNKTITDEDAETIQEAIEDIDVLTYNRIKSFNDLTDFQKDKVCLAISLQAAFRKSYSDMLENPLSAYSINGVSMSFDNKKIAQFSGIYTTGKIYSVLRQTGLTYPGMYKAGRRWP